jgi:hypothetical protein
MFGKGPRIKALELRKQLLIAESELNRAQLTHEWQSMAHGVRDLIHRAKTLGAWASTAAALVAGLTAWRSGPAPAGPTKLSWSHKLLKAVRLAVTIWSALRARPQKEASR